MNKPKIGLLSLYLELYDKFMPERRVQTEKFYHTIVAELGKRGLDVTTAPACRSGLSDAFPQNKGYFMTV